MSRLITMTTMTAIAAVLAVGAAPGAGVGQDAGGASVSERLSSHHARQAQHAQQAPTGIVLTLEQITETRRADLTGDDLGGGFDMFDPPGLELRFAMRTPRGRHVVDVRQPVTLDAFDSEGTDLTAIAPTTFGRLDYVETISEWQDAPHALTFRLALPARAAEHFTLTARMDALTYRETETGTVRPGLTWTPVKGDLFDHENVQVRVERKRGNLQLVFMPGTVRDMIESVELERSGTRLEREGAMWNDLQVAYLFTVDPSAAVGDEDARVVATVGVRKGLATVPIEIDIREHPLP